MAIPHRATKRFWQCYGDLPVEIQELADRQFLQLKNDPGHPGLRFKQIGKLWSARVGSGHRALAEADQEGFTWLWIGTHAEYDRLLRR
jgi:hypothetical protein